MKTTGYYTSTHARHNDSIEHVFPGFTVSYMISLVVDRAYERIYKQITFL
jgi:hypothetical protein